MFFGDYSTLQLDMSNSARPQRQLGTESYEVAGGGAPLSRKQRDDYEHALTRLVDQFFNIKRYPDPLAPRHSSDPEDFAQDVTPEMENRWLARIKASKGELGGG